MFSPPTPSGTATPRIRTFLINRRALTGHGLRSLLEAEGNLTVVGQSSAAGSAVHDALTAEPDVVIVDEVLSGGESGVDVVRAITAKNRSIRGLVLGRATADSVYGALFAGASGFLPDTASPRVLINAVRVVATGQSFLDTSLCTDAARPRIGGRPASVLSALTRREREVLELIGEGLTNGQIAASLHLSPHTVKNHVTAVLAKLGVTRRNQALLLVSGGAHAS